MKKLLLLLITVFCIKGFSQSSIQVSDLTTSVTISANMIIAATTTANSTTGLEFNVKNIGSTAKTYKVKRYDIQLYTAASVTADAHFCFAGSCYGSNILVSLTSLSLNPGQSASEIQGTYNTLTTDLDETPSVGYSLVKYTIFNTVTPSDSMQFSIKYNSPSGISELSNNALSSFEIYPNPATDLTVLKVNSQKAMDAKLIVYNALGAVVYEKPISVAEGKNKIELNVNDLNSGVYFAQIKMANSNVTKKLIIK